MQKVTHRLARAAENVEFKSLPTVKIEHKDVFSFSDFYALLHGWCADAGYVDADEDFAEAFFLLKDAPTGKDIQVRWRLEKKVPDFFRYRLDLDIDVSGLKDVEVVEQGRKKKVQKGGLAIEIRPAFIIDYSEWEKEPVTKYFKDFILKPFKGLWYKKIKAAEGELFGELTDLQNTIKAYLELEAPSIAQQYHKRKSG